MRPYYLDGDLAQRHPKVLQGPVIPVTQPPLIDGGCCGFCAVFKDRGEAITPAGLSYKGVVCDDISTRATADAGLSKLNSMLGSFVAASMRAPK
jgi:hypothetical protein